MKMNIKKYSNICFIALSLAIISIAMTYGQDKTITLSTNHSGATHDKVARDAVTLNPGFSFSPSGSYSFTARTDETMICDVDYGVSNPDRNLNTSYEVGTTAGSFNVTSVGAATYTIPIFVSPGTAGMQPSLAVSYNSNGGNSVFGKGWSLSGLSAIYRAPSTYYHDGYVDPIDYDNNDAFMMDGSRLIKDGTTYKTEIEGYSNITPTFSGSAITKFTVQTKNGKTIEYGGTSASKQSNTDGTRYFAWYITKVQDAFGNYMEYVYENDVENGIRLVKINYTGNSGTITPYNSIFFFYEKREDIRSSYVYGKEVKNNLLLYKIRCEAEGLMARTYEFKYMKDSDVSLLVEIIEKGSDNTRFNSTAFDYYGNLFPIAPGNKVDLSLIDNFSQKKFGDFNNDGRSDLIFKVNTEGKLYFHKTNVGGESITSNGSLYIGSDKYEIGDFNGDGLSDIVVYSSSLVKWYKSTGTGFTHISSSNISLSGIDDVYASDVTGDNITDVVIRRGSSIYVYKGDNSSPFSSNFYNSSFDWGHVSIKEHHFRDFNGDGIIDLGILHQNYFQVYQFEGDNIVSQLPVINLNYSAADARFVVGDFNGDGKTDIIIGKEVSNDLTNLKTYISTGKDFIVSDFYDQTISSTYGVFMASFDSDGDGKFEVYTINDFSLQESPGFYYGYVYSFSGQTFTKNTEVVAPIYKFNDFNGDGILDGLISYDDDIFFNYTVKGVGNTKHRLETIVDGVNNKTIIEYESISNETVYTPHTTGGTYPLTNINGPMYVVSKVKQSDGLGDYFETTYNYEGAKFFRSAGRFLGFSKMEVTSSESQITTRSNLEFHATYPYATTTTKTVIDNADSPVSKSKSNNIISHIANKRVKIYPQYASSWDYLNEVNDSTVFTFDSNGNITQKKTFIGNSGTTTTYFESFITTSGSPVPNVPKTVRTVSKRGAKPSFEKKVTISYNTTNGFVNYKIVDPDESKPLRIDYTPVTSRLGLVWKEKLSGADITDRETEYQWDSKGRFVTKAYSPEDQLTEYTYDPCTGNLLTSELPAGFVEENTYDGFGRLTYSKSSNANTSLYWYSGSIANCIYYAKVSGSDISDQYVYYDRLGRDLSTRSKAYETSKTIVTNKSYNAKGQLAWASAPFFDGDTEYKTEFTYDDLGRVTEENYANNTKKVNYTYSKRQVVVTNTSASQSVTRKFDAYGNVNSIIDDNSNELKYSYNSAGNVDTVYSLDGEVTTLYDEYGRTKQVKDPDFGVTSYSYYATGELKTETINGNTTTYTYNKNGQVKTLAVQEGTTTYSYNGTTGLLSSIDGLNNNDVSFTYDNIGRMNGYTEIVDGTGYNFVYTYKDSYSDRLASKTYPGNFKIKYDYDRGYLDEIRRDSDNSLIWQLNETTPHGVVERYTNGNSLSSINVYNYKTGNIERMLTGSIQDLRYDFDDATGNLISREDYKRGLVETFGYDDLNRLTSITFNNNTINVGFSENGNISSKGDLGTYEYNATQPHAVSKITPTVGYAPEEQTATYTSFDKLCALEQGTKSLTLTYGYDFNRRKTVFTDGSTTKTKIFVPGGYEKITEGGSKEFCYISTPAGLTAVYDKTNDEMFYVHPDHLGSIHFITDESGSVEQELSFDAWGRQRNATNWGYSSLPTPKFERGYTFHEHLSEFDLINMNGRVYDPMIARFLSPDPVLQSPGNLQNYNRYSYCYE